MTDRTGRKLSTKAISLIIAIAGSAGAIITGAIIMYFGGTIRRAVALEYGYYSYDVDPGMLIANSFGTAVILAGIAVIAAGVGASIASAYRSYLYSEIAGKVSSIEQRMQVPPAPPVYAQTPAGSVPNPSGKICPNCGATNKQGAVFCVQCGRTI